MDVIRQKVRVDFEYPVYFTTGVVTPSNLLLRDVVARSADRSPSQLVVVLDQGVLESPSAPAGADCRVRPPPSHGAQPVGARGRRAWRRSGEERPAPRGRHPSRHQRCRPLPPFVRGGDRRRRGARRRRLRRRHGPSRHPSHPRADDGARAGRFGDGRQERHQRVREEELPGHVRAAVRGASTTSASSRRCPIATGARACRKRSRPRSSRTGRSSTSSRSMPPRCRSRDLSAMEQVIRRCAVLHLSHIASGGDPFELGSSRPLDFGHWSAHKLEQLTDHRLSHGEAVAIGIALDTTYSYLAGFLPEDDWRRIISLLPALGLSVYVPELGQNLDRDNDPASVLARAGRIPRTPWWLADDPDVAIDRRALRRARDPSRRHDPEHRRAPGFRARPPSARGAS